MTQLQTDPLAGSPTGNPLAPFPRAESLDERARRFEAAQNTPGFWDQVKSIDATTFRAAYTKGSIGAVPYWLSQFAEQPDPNFIFDEEKFNEYTKGINQKYWHYFEDVVNEQSARRARFRAMQVQQINRDLAEHGAAGTAVDIFASIVSPENVIATAATMGLGSFAGIAKGGTSAAGAFRAASLSRAAGMGFINAAATLPVDIIVAGDNPDIGAMDVAANFAGGFAGGFVSDVMVGQRVASGVQLSNRATRFGAVGGAQGLGTAGVDFFNDDKSSGDMALAFAVNMGFGGFLNAIPSSRVPSPLSKAMHDASDDLADRATLNVAAQSGAPMTPKGKARAEELDVKVKQRAADEMSVAVGEPIVVGTPNPKNTEAFGTLWEADAARVDAVRAAATGTTIREPWQMTKKEASSFDSGEVPINNESNGPWTGEVPPVGTYRTERYTDVVQQLVEVDPKSLGITEEEAPGRAHSSFPVYVQWAKEGKIAPPINVVWNQPTGRWVSTNRRRVLAARDAGVDKILAWRDVTHSDGTPVKHKDAIEEAVNSGKPVPASVLADYPDLAPKAPAATPERIGGPDFAVGAASQKELSGKEVDPNLSVPPAEGADPTWFYVGGVRPGPHDFGWLSGMPDFVKRAAQWANMGGFANLSPDRVTSFVANALSSSGLSGQSSLHLQRKMLVDRFRAQTISATDEAYKVYKESMKARGERPLSRAQLARAMYVRMHQKAAGTDIPNPELDAFADAIDSGFKSVRDMVGAYDKRNVRPHQKYTLPHLWNGEAIDKLVRNPNVGYDKTVQWIADAIYREMTPDVSKIVSGSGSLFPKESVEQAITKARAKARAYADRIIDNAGKRNEARVMADSKAFTYDVRELIEEWIDDTLGNKITGQEKRDLLFKLGPADPKTGPSFLQERIPLDVETSMSFKRVYGDRIGEYGDGAREHLSIADIMEQDVEVLFDRFLHQASSHAAFMELNRVLRLKFPNEDIPDFGNYKELSSWMRERSGQLAAAYPDRWQDVDGKWHTTNRGRFAKDAEAIDVLLKQLHDQPGFDIPLSAVRDGLVLLNNVNRVVSSSKIGHLGMPIQNSAVVADLVADTGVRAVRDLIPSAWDYITNIRTGVHKPSRTDLMVAQKLGWGVAPIVNRNMRVMFDDDSGVQAGWTSRFSQNYAHTVSRLSGDAHTNSFFQAFGYVKAQEKMHDVLLSGKPLGERFRRDYGLSVEDADAIRAEYLKHNEVSKEVAGMFDPHTEKWENRKAAALYHSSVTQAAARSLNIVDRSKRPAIFANSLLAPVTSLRSWAISAFDNYLLRRTAGLWDKEGFNARNGIAFVTTAAAGMTLYALRTYVMSLGRPDQKEYLEKMLSERNLALAAIGKSSTASIMPMFADFGFAFAGKEPPFAKTRVSGLGDRSDPWATLTSTPMGSWVQDATRTAQVPFLAMFDESYMWNQNDANAALNSAFIPNLFNLRNFLQHTYDDLPRGRQTQRSAGSGIVFGSAP